MSIDAIAPAHGRGHQGGGKLHLRIGAAQSQGPLNEFIAVDLADSSGRTGIPHHSRLPVGFGEIAQVKDRQGVGLRRIGACLQVGEKFPRGARISLCVDCGAAQCLHARQDQRVGCEQSKGIGGEMAHVVVCLRVVPSATAPRQRPCRADIERPADELRARLRQRRKQRKNDRNGQAKHDPCDPFALHGSLMLRAVSCGRAATIKTRCEHKC